RAAYVNREQPVPDVDAMFDEIHRDGAIDILVNNAGIAHTAEFAEIPIDIWDRLFAVHVRGTFLVTRRALPRMYARRSGRIINTVSQLAYKGAPGLAHYTACKGALVSLSRTLALEAAPHNVNVNAVAPGATQTPILAAVPEALMDAIRASIPLGRIAEVDDIVPTYILLASDEGRHYQGQCLSPNGGDVFL
ncbi:MAG: SDR family oxidoreductase, partial [Pseudomonadota bacterium]